MSRAGERREYQALEGVPPLVARVLMSVIFLLSGFNKLIDWNGNAAYMAAHGVPVVSLALAAAAAIEIVCGLLLLLGVQTRSASLLLALYVVLVTLFMHNFWAFGGIERQQQMVNFLKNLVIIGGLVHVFSFGPGRVSLGRPFRRRMAPPVPVVRTPHPVQP